MEDKLERALKELLVTSNTVIIPGFGAFVATDIPAMVDSKNNVIYPPRRKVNYDPSQTNDDGLFLGHYARQERITKETASEHIAQFVEEINHRLQRGNPWVVEDLGKFIIDGLDNLNFFPDPDQNFVPQSYGLPDIELTGAKPDYPEIEVVEPIVTEKEEAPVKKKRSKKWVVILLILAAMGAGGFAFVTQMEMGKKLFADLKHKVEELMAPKKEEVKVTETPTVAEEPEVTEVISTIDTALSAPIDSVIAKPIDSVKPAAKAIIAKAAPAIDSVNTAVVEEAKTVVPPAPKPANKPAVAKSYQPRNGSKSFDVPDRLDIEATKLDQFVKASATPKKDGQLATNTKPVTSPKPEIKSTKKEDKPAAKPVAKPAAKMIPGPKPDEIDNTPIAAVKAVRSGESIYSKYQVVVNEFRSIDEAVENSDRYNRMGYNVAVVQFKDGKFGVCLARSADKSTADKLLSNIRSQIPSARMKEY